MLGGRLIRLCALSRRGRLALKRRGLTEKRQAWPFSRPYNDGASFESATQGARSWHLKEGASLPPVLVPPTRKGSGRQTLPRKMATRSGDAQWVILPSGARRRPC